MQKQLFMISLMVLLLALVSACASIPENSIPAPVEDKVVVEGEVLKLPQEQTIQSEPLNDAPPVSPVTRGLLAKAGQQKADKNWDGATNSLERALRIEPQNPVLWNRLAEINYEQQRWQQAVQFAARSNVYTGRNLDLRRNNWYLMKLCYEAMGDAVNAQKYHDKLNR